MDALRILAKIRDRLRQQDQHDNDDAFVEASSVGLGIRSIVVAMQSCVGNAHVQSCGIMAISIFAYKPELATQVLEFGGYVKFS